jgi:acyl carrier protein
MLADEIRMNIKRSIANIANLELSSIADNASYKNDLMLDSLTILEIAVDAEMQFQIKIPDEELSGLDTIDETVNLIQRYLGGSAVTV